MESFPSIEILKPKHGNSMIYQISPVTKPRMTISDKWKKRPCVLRYWDFKDKVREAEVLVYDFGSFVVFTVPMPKSWSKKKKKAMDGTPHQQTPDIDNFLKGLLDAIFDDDSHIWDIRAKKVWGYSGTIEVVPDLTTNA